MAKKVKEGNPGRPGPNGYPAGKTLPYGAVAGKAPGKTAVSKAPAGKTLPGQSIQSQGAKKRRSGFPAKKATGGDAPRVAVGGAGTIIDNYEISPAVSPAALLPVIPSAAQMSGPIVIASKALVINGRGKLTPSMNGGGDGIEAYKGFDLPGGQKLAFTTGAITRSLRARSCSDSVLFLIFHVNGIHLETTPVPTLSCYLETLFTGNFIYIPVAFDLVAAKGSANLQEATAAIARALTKGELASIQRILAVVVSHSNPEGDIHIGPEGTAAALPDQVFDVLMPAALLEAFGACDRVAENNLLIILTCGAVFTVADAVKRINTWFKDSKSFWSLVGFEAGKLQPEVTTSFLQSIVCQFYFSLKNFLHGCLASSNQLGSHSAVIYLSGDGTMQYRYAWAHPVHSPFGQPIPLSCKCGLVGTAAPGHRNKGQRQDLRQEIVKVACSVCRHVSTFQMPMNLEFIIEDGDEIWTRMPLIL
ncbi:hypothetical protein K438DRAFT_1962961 [Mycena galopus ATCC 62051]|nr:hypothetical protein K438DRAFT_1962961 [Mycena galopus ATCC 62051]